ncbi:MAG: efflux RND transporter periplasmic adaptor subunit [Bacteroidales bacterium]|jgi:membrane fusion protein (multidrug efflux system)|nr:efflux RND transporter periplasmic adaptor subunit [Bacteroidales bacterium]
MTQKSKQIALAVVLVAGAAILAFAIIRSGNKPPAQRSRGALQVDAVVVQPSVVEKDIFVPGLFLPYDQVELKSEIAGRVVTLNLPEGKQVKKGTLLVKIFDEDLQATLKKMQAQYKIQRQVFERQTELFKVNGISKNDYEKLELDLLALAADIDIVKTQIRKTEVLAPFDGVIGLRTISEGAFVPAAMLLGTISTPNSLKIDFSVPERYSIAMRAGKKVDFSTTTVPKATATVIATDQSVDAQTQNLRVRALVDKPNPNFVPGGYCQVSLNLDTRNDAIVIPSQAVVMQIDGRFVIVARGGKAHFSPVQTGVRSERGIEITQGVAAGDTIITSGILFLREGSPLDYASITSN